MPNQVASNLNRRASWAAGALIALACMVLLLPAGASAKPAPYKLIKGVYDARYCEKILIVLKQSGHAEMSDAAPPGQGAEPGGRTERHLADGRAERDA